MIRLGRFGLAALLLVWVSAPLASAQEEYAGDTGDLEDVETTIIVSFSGDGFAADSTVLLTLSSTETDEEIDLGTIDADEAGAILGSVTIPADLEPGLYLLTATGVTEDGATRVLTAEVWIAGDVTDGPDTSMTEATTTSALATTTSSTLPRIVIDALLAGLNAVRTQVD